MTSIDSAEVSPGPPQRFAALRNRDCRPYLFTSGLSMMADNTEHVITYWVLWQKFHSPELAGFEIISHWLPYLLLSVWFGSLAERFDCRRLIQIGQGLFMFVSIAWGVLFLTDSLQLWEACVLLVLHGCAGAIWGPAEQLLLHDFVERKDLASAVRLNATFRNLGVLLGPVVGSALLLGLGPTWGIFVNACFYLPMTILMARTRFTGHLREPDAVPSERSSLIDTLRVLGHVRHNQALVSMIVVSGLSAITIGGALQVAMPTFANMLGAGDGGLAYGVLLFANGAGGVVGGFLLEATRAIRPIPLWGMISTLLLGLFTLIFAATHVYLIAIVALIVGGVAGIASASITQSVVQLEATPGERGRVYGLFGVFSSGMRTGNGLTLGILGAIWGIPAAMAVCSVALALGTAITAAIWRRGIWTSVSTWRKRESKRQDSRQ